MQADIESANGSSALLLLRARGAKQSYMAGFQDGQLCIWKQDFGGMEVLAQKPFAVELGRSYQVVFQAVGDALTLEIDGAAALQVQDASYTSGMVGLGALTMGRSFFGGLHITEC